MAGFSKIIFSGLAALVSAETFEPGEVVVITKDNFEDFLKSSPDGALVEFYAPWCGHCKKLEPEYDSAAKKLKDDDVKILLGKVDATIETTLASEHEVQGYPTLKWFVGGKPTEYDGPREADGIVSWIKSMTGPAVVEGEPKDDDKLSVTLHSADDVEAFESLAKANRKKAQWYHVKSGSGKVVLKHLGEPAIETEASEDLEKFFKENNFPLFGGLDGDTFSQYIDRGNGLIWSLFEMTTDNVKEVVEQNREMMTDIAKSDAGKDYSVTWTNTNEFGKVLESMFGVTEFPKLIVQKKAGDKKNFIYEGEMTKDAIQKYIEDVNSGAIVANLKSEEVPEEPQADPVKMIVGKTLEEKLFSDTYDVMFEVYAPWCGHCKKLDPEYLKVAKKVYKEGFEDIIMIAKMDGTANDSPVDSISWSGFPTLYYIKAGEKEPMKYDGPREAKGIWKWIKKNHSKADEIKEKLAAKKSGSGSDVEEEDDKKKKEEL